MGAGDDVPKAVEDLARMAGFERLRDLGVPEPELPVVAAAAAERVGAKANPRLPRPTRSPILSQRLVIRPTGRAARNRRDGQVFERVGPEPRREVDRLQPLGGVLRACARSATTWSPAEANACR